MHEKLTKCPNFTRQPEKLTKSPNFSWYMPEKINKMPEFYMILPEKYFSRIFGGKCPLLPPSPTPINELTSNLWRQTEMAGQKCQHLVTHLIHYMSISIHKSQCLKERDTHTLRNTRWPGWQWFYTTHTQFCNIKEVWPWRPTRNFKITHIRWSDQLRDLDLWPAICSLC